MDFSNFQKSIVCFRKTKKGKYVLKLKSWIIEEIFQFHTRFQKNSFYSDVKIIDNQLFQLKFKYYHNLCYLSDHNSSFFFDIGVSIGKYSRFKNKGSWSV